LLPALAARTPTPTPAAAPPAIPSPTFALVPNPLDFFASKQGTVMHNKEITRMGVSDLVMVLDVKGVLKEMMTDLV
jgi:hypothetical protein